MSTLLNKSLVGFALVVGFAVTTGSAKAGPITVTFEHVGPGIGNAGQYNWNTGSTTYEGVLYTPMGNGSSSMNHFITFCIERNQYISNGSTYNDYYFSNLELSPVPGPAMPSSAPDDIRAMWAEFRSSLDTNTESAAFQEAVWHLADPGYNPSLSGAELTYYNAYLNSSNWQSGLANLASMVNQERQDQILELEPGYIVDENGNIIPVPAPATLVVALLVAPAMVLRRRLARKVA